LKRTLLVSASLCILACLSGVATYVVLDGLSESPDGRSLGLLAFPVGLALMAWASSRYQRVHVPYGTGLLAVVIGIAAAQAGPTFAVVFGSLILGVLVYALGSMLLRLPAFAGTRLLIYQA